MKDINETIRESINITESSLSEDQRDEYQRFLDDLNKAFDEGGADAVNDFLQRCKDEDLYEGVFGGIVGFLAGPSVGKIVARALGLEKGILYDLITSRLVSAAIGNAIQKELRP